MDASIDTTLPSMSLQMISPSYISFSGNTYIEVNGVGFKGQISAFVDEKPCTDLSIIDETKIKCKAPALDDVSSESTYVNVRVTNGVQTLLLKNNLKYRTDAIYEIKKFAGTLANSGHRDGSAARSRFISPSKPLSVGNSIFVSDTEAHTVRKYDKTTGELATLAGRPLKKGNTDGVGQEATLNLPVGLAHHDGYLYVVENGSCTIRRIHIATKTSERFAGAVQDSSSFTGCEPDPLPITNGLDAKLPEMTAVATDGTYLYVTNSSPGAIDKILKISLTGSRTVSAMSGSDSLMDYPVDIIYNANYIYYMAYATSGGSSYIGRISTITGTFEELIGPLVSRVGGIDVKGNTLYVTSPTNQSIVSFNLSLPLPLTPQTLVGSGLQGQLDGTGTGTKLFNPAGLHVDGDLLYFTSFGARNLRQVNLLNLNVTTLSGASQ